MRTPSSLGSATRRPRRARGRTPTCGSPTRRTWAACSCLATRPAPDGRARVGAARRKGWRVQATGKSAREQRGARASAAAQRIGMGRYRNGSFLPDGDLVVSWGIGSSVDAVPSRRNRFSIPSSLSSFSSLIHMPHPQKARDAAGGGSWRPSCSSSEASTSTAKKSRTDWSSSKRSAERARRGKNNFDAARLTEVQDYRIFAATWNVGGKSPPRGLNLDEWLHTSPPADIYVLGFQEIVPLNAGNVLGTEDNLPAKKWVSLIRRTLNKNPGASGCGGYHTPSPVLDPVVELDADFEGSARRQENFSFFHRRSFHNLSRSLRMDGDFMFPPPRLDRRFSVCDPVNLGGRPSDFDGNLRCPGSPDEDNIDMEVSDGAQISPFPHSSSASAPSEQNDDQSNSSRYCLVASKQMVGIFLTVWVRNEIRDDVRNLKVSCVGRGLMGYLGNKGSISISMSLHQTSFCFICCHLTSGEKEGDELRRNSDVLEILRKTRFPRVRGAGDVKSPETILEHDRIIWLGDLNYRIALSYCSAKALVEMHNWKQLLEKDQLRMQQRYGRVFQGWREGRIYFPPTYKYSFNSDRYAGEGRHPKEKRRTPAWCDRILWYGNGLNQLSYVRGESRFSDHRPVYSIFLAEVDIVHQRRRNMGYFSSRIEVEELLPHSQSYREIKFY